MIYSAWTSQVLKDLRCPEIMTHRTFVALNISDQLKNKIIDWKNNFQNKSPATFNHIRWTPEKNLHITLIPPFEINNMEVQLQPILQSIKEVVLKYSPFDVSFNDISYGPSIYNPRLIWLTGNAPIEMVRLKKELTDSLARQLLKLNLLSKSHFIQNSRKDFLLHLTIARFNKFDYKYFYLKNIRERFEFKETLKELILYESFLKKEGAEYKALEKFILPTS